jgi:hypothetical protein
MAEELPGISFEESLDLFIYFSCRNFWRVSFSDSLANNRCSTETLWSH